MTERAKKYQNCCRCCLLDKGTMSSILDAGIEDMLFALASVVVNKDDNLPKVVCRRCLLMMSQAYNFRRTVLKSQKILEEAAGDSNNQSRTIATLQPNLIEAGSDKHREKEDMLEEEQNLMNGLEVDISDDDHELMDSNCGTKMITINAEDNEHLFTNYLENSEALEVNILGPIISDTVEVVDYIQQENLEDTENGALICSLCNEIFLTLNEFTIHQSQHSEITSPAQHLCPTCGKQYKLATSLARHRRLHEATQARSCGVCQKQFPSDSCLKTHEICHTRSKDHKCDECGRTFTQLSSLNKHRRHVHCRTEHYNCRGCSKYFYDEGSLKRHEVVHRLANT